MKLGCIYPHRWSPWYPGERYRNYEHLFRRTRHCTRCGKTQVQRGDKYFACAGAQYRGMRERAGILD